MRKFYSLTHSINGYPEGTIVEELAKYCYHSEEEFKEYIDSDDWFYWVKPVNRNVPGFQASKNDILEV